MTIAYTPVGMPKRMFDVAKRRVAKIEKEISERKEELAVWKEILAGLCQDCEGAGKVRGFVAPDETETLKCEKCGGKGVLA